MSRRRIRPICIALRRAGQTPWLGALTARIHPLVPEELFAVTRWEQKVWREATAHDLELWGEAEAETRPPPRTASCAGLRASRATIQE